MGMSLIKWSFVFVSSSMHILNVLCCLVGVGRPEGVEGGGVDLSSLITSSGVGWSESGDVDFWWRLVC